MKKSSFILLLGSLIALYACQSVKTNINSIHKSPFVKESILWPDKISSHLNAVTVNITFPNNYKMLDGANPTIKLMTAEGRLIEDHLMDKIPFTFNLNKKINSSQIFADLSIYYCRDNKMAMCLKKNVLYEINIDEHSVINTLNINYAVKEEAY